MRIDGFLICVVLLVILGLSAQNGHAQTPSEQKPSNLLMPAGDPVGNVVSVSGTATITRFGATAPLKVDDDIYMGDGLQTAADSALGVTFNDETTFNLSASSKITVDKYVYEDGGKANAALFNVARGTVAFVASAVAKTGDMKISTPTTTLGIRGTTGLIEVPDNAATTGNDVAIKLYPDADGRVGHIEVNDRNGVRLGLLSQGASGFSIHARPNGGFAATRLIISPQQAMRDQGFVRQVHAAQITGRQIVARQREQRLRNPSRQPGPRQQLQRQPQLQPPNGRGNMQQRGQDQRQPPGAKRSDIPRPPGAQPPVSRGNNPPRMQRQAAPQRGAPPARNQRQPKENRSKESR